MRLQLSFLFTAAIVSSSFCQVQDFFVRPNQTDPGYAAQDSHFVAYNTSVRLNKLLLFIGGTFSSPKQYDYFTRHAAGLGFDAISLNYPNSVLTTLLAGSPDSLAFNKFRQEICFGTQVSNAVNVDSLNSIYTRTLKLIQYLALTYPSQNWDQYLATPTTLDWSKILVSGHSQGSGHACYLAKLFSVNHVIMFSGPSDYSTYFSNSAPWLREAGVTTLDKHFVFLHLQDEIVPFNRQYENIRGLGMLQSDDTTLIDNRTPPFNDSHCLYSNLSVSGSPHSSTVIFSSTPLDSIGNLLFAPVWNYMLLDFIGTNLSYDSRNLDVKIYPNPTGSLACLETDPTQVTEIRLYSAFGSLIRSQIITDKKELLDLTGLPAGIYYIKSNRISAPLIKTN